jgi:hypothetical protein
MRLIFVQKYTFYDNGKGLFLRQPFFFKNIFKSYLFQCKKNDLFNYYIKNNL